jgi:hypothetical protein
MPARATRLYIFVEGEPCRSFPLPVWWDRRALFTRYNQRRVDLSNPLYESEALLLEGYEAQAWDEEARAAYLEQPTYSSHTRAFLRPLMAEIEAALDQASWVIVYDFEWESGLA